MHLLWDRLKKLGVINGEKKILTASSGIALRDPVSADHLKKVTSRDNDTPNVRFGIAV